MTERLDQGAVLRDAGRSARRKNRARDVSHAGSQLSKMAEVSGLRSRNHFEPNCKSRVGDEGKPLAILSDTLATLGGPGIREEEF